MNQTFSDLGVNADLISALDKQSITTPTSIQTAAIPLVLEHNDVYLNSETGTGKTLAYLLPLFSAIDPHLAQPQVIVVAPTHELAIQIHRQCGELSQLGGVPIRAVLLIGGTPRDRQLEKLKKKPHVVVGSPGRIRDLIVEGKLKLAHVSSVVIDEADRLLVSESFDDVKAILDAAPPKRQLIFVSATEHKDSTRVIALLSPNVRRLKPGPAPVNANIDHFFLRAEERDKPEVVRKLIHAMKPVRTIVFVHRNETAEILAEKLTYNKLRVADIHSARDKETRKKAMDGFRSGKVDILIASDVAARGLDVRGVSHVFNIDVPTESDAYLHRVGRSGRAGVQGVAVSIITEPQTKLIARFTRDLKIEITEIRVERGKIFRVKPRPE